MLPFRFVTVTFRIPVAAVRAIVSRTVSCVALLNVVEFTVTPVPEKVILAPVAKPPPVTIRVCAVPVRRIDAGLSDVIVGPLATVKRLLGTQR